MSRPGNNRNRPRAGTKAWAPDIEAAGRPAGFLIPDGVVNFSRAPARRPCSLGCRRSCTRPTGDLASGRLCFWHRCLL